MTVILLDTTVASGCLSNIVEEEKNSSSEKWWQCVENLIIGLDNPEIIIPTTVYYEIAVRDGRMFQVFSKTEELKAQSKIFKYIDYGISSKILQEAAFFKLKCDNKMGWFDAVLAAYSLIYGHLIITINQTHFPHYYFDSLKLDIAPISNKKSERQAMYLLKPKLEVWLKEK